MIVGLVSGASRKLNEKAPAGLLYSKSPLFRYSLEYCKRNYEAVYILSPKYGLLPITEIVDTYEESLANIQRLAFKEWLAKVVNQIKEVIPTGSELFFYAGKRYRKLIPLLQSEYVCHEPTKGLGIGKQLKWLRHQLG